MYLLLDFETNSADPTSTEITDVGAIGFEVEEDYFKITHSLSQLCYEPEYPPQTPFLVELTGISDEMLKLQGKPRKEVFEQELIPLVAAASVVFCHKVSFDKRVFESTCARLGLTFPPREHVCTLSNFQWPKRLSCHKLGHLSWEHGLSFLARNMHRAHTDCLALLGLLQPGALHNYSIDEILAYAREPWVYMRAEVAAPWTDGGVQNGIAKSLGFSWESPKGDDTHKWTKTWVIRCKARFVNDILEQVRLSKSPFRVTKIEGIS